jgi:hypothetical protein
VKADISRNTFNRKKHYRKVHKQQGRVQTDADSNEQIDIQVYHDNISLRDIIGKTGGPKENAGFEILSSTLGYTIGPYRYYVDGKLCENDTESEDGVNIAINAIDQKDLPPVYFTWDDLAQGSEEFKRFQDLLKDNFANFNLDWALTGNVKVKKLLKGKRIGILSEDNANSLILDLDDIPENATNAKMTIKNSGLTIYKFFTRATDKLRIGYSPALPTIDGLYIVYLDLWDHHITYLDDPEIREVALGGPDTTTRTKTLWQVKALRVGDLGNSYTCESPFESWDKLIMEPSLKLQARAEPTVTEKEPCELQPGAGFRRLSNQLYHVAIHNGGKANDTATCKFSRENGSIVTKALDFKKDQNKIVVSDVGRELKLGFNISDWLEVVDDRHELWEIPGSIAQIVDIKDTTIVFDPATKIGEDITNENFPQDYHPKVRRWDSVGQIPVTTDLDPEKFIGLEDGLEIKFSDGDCKTGNYWQIAARTATANIEWPNSAGKPIALSPQGIKHHFARLAFLEYSNNQIVKISDCRRIFDPLTDIKPPVIQALQPDLILTNGMAFKYVPSLGVVNKIPLNDDAKVFRVIPGEMTRWYIVNAGPREPITFQFTGLILSVLDGTQMKKLPSIDIPPGCAKIIEVIFPGPGVYIGMDYRTDHFFRGGCFAVLASEAPNPPHPDKASVLYELPGDPNDHGRKILRIRAARKPTMVSPDNPITPNGIIYDTTYFEGSYDLPTGERRILNDSLPGPAIKLNVEQGTPELKLIFTNDTLNAQGIAFQGASGTQDILNTIKAGETKDWILKFTEPGIFLYYGIGDGFNGFWERIKDGMYGSIAVVRGKEPAREFCVVFSEIYLPK